MVTAYVTSQGELLHSQNPKPFRLGITYTDKE